MLALLCLNQLEQEFQQLTMVQVRLQGHVLFQVLADVWPIVGQNGYPSKFFLLCTSYGSCHQAQAIPFQLVLQDMLQVFQTTNRIRIEQSYR